MSETRSIEYIRRYGFSDESMQRLAAEKVEMERTKKDVEARLPGQFFSLREDGETRTFLFTTNFQKYDAPAKDWATGRVIPNKVVKKWRWQVVDVTDPDNPSEPGIFERGFKESEMIVRWLSQGKVELVVVRSGVRNSTNTSYTIYPSGR
jgi:hypothetical protein